MRGMVGPDPVLIAASQSRCERLGRSEQSLWMRAEERIGTGACGPEKSVAQWSQCFSAPDKAGEREIVAPNVARRPAGQHAFQGGDRQARA